MTKVCHWFGILIAGVMIILFWGCSRKGRGFGSSSCELDSLQARGMIKRMTGRDLPPDTGAMRAIYAESRALDSDVEYVFAAFGAGPATQAYVLETFGGQYIREFPDEENSPSDLDMSVFKLPYARQRELGVALFDARVLNRIVADMLTEIGTGSFPADAVRGYYLASDTNSGVHYRVVVLTQLDTVYIAVERNRRH